MDPYSPVHLIQPLQAAPVAIPKSQSAKSILRHMESTQLAPIREETRVTSEVKAAIDQSLAAQLKTIQRQRNEALEALDAASAVHRTHVESIRAHERRGIETSNRVQELEAKNKTLEERCVKLSAWVEQHRIAKLQAPKDSTHELNQALDALANLDARHTALTSDHAALRAEGLKLTQSGERSVQAKLSELEERASRAERASQSLACAKRLACSAPVGRELLDKATSVLASGSDVLRHVQGTSPQLRDGLNQVCDALLALEGDLRGHGAEVGAWLAKRAAALE
jgi:myosin heavy subunit